MPAENNMKSVRTGFRCVQACTLVVFSLVTLGLHIQDVDVGQVCTDTNVPVDCYKKDSGRFRAINFTAPTTSLTFINYGGGPVYGVNGLYRSMLEVPYKLVYDPLTTFNRTQEWCVAEYPDNLYTQRACKAEMIQDMYEVPNSEASGTTWALAGGVHIWFFLWLSLHLSASFSVLMLPHWEYSAFERVKIGILFIWHLLGLSFSIVLFVDDDYFNMLLPVNNAIIGITFELFTMVVQLLWVRTTSTLGMAAYYDITPSRPKGYRLTPGGNHTVDMKAGTSELSALMTLDSHSRQRVHTSDTLRYNDGRVEVRRQQIQSYDDWDVFETKKNAGELMESVFIEFALTMPLIMVAIYCMSVRVNMDWVLQSLYLRSIMIFLSLSLLFKCLPLTGSDYLQNYIANMVGVVTAPVFCLAVSLLYDWYTPLAHSTHWWGTAVNPGVSHIAVMAAIVVFGVILGSITFIFFSLLAISNWGNGDYCVPKLNAHGNRNTKDESVWMNADEATYYVVQFFVFILRIMVFAYAVNPELWYEEYDKADVMLNYISA
eukprot:3479985-Rhodomonas_salina.4